MRSSATDFQRGRRGQRGAILPVIFLTMGVIAVIGYSISAYISRSYSQLVDEDTMMEAQMLAADLKEFGKYLILYEKVHFQTKPLAIDPSRRAALETVWGQKFGAVNNVLGPSILNSCGGYSALVVFIGDLKLDGQPVFCPAYLRHPEMTGELLEHMFFENWIRGGQSAQVLHGFNLENSQMADVVTRAPGSKGYVVKITVGAFDPDRSGQSKTIDYQWIDDPNNFIFMSYGQRIAQRMKQLKVSAKLEFEIMAESAGFVPAASERFVKVRSVVEFDGALKDSSGATDSESFILSIPTIKDFAIFMPYPTTGVYAGTGVTRRPIPTNRFSQAVTLPSNSEIHGRVYFNGDIDVPLQNLPTFSETVFISGGLTSVQDARPETIELLKTKFRKGIVTNFSASRFVLDGACAAGSSVSITNDTELFCKTEWGDEFGIAEYLTRLSGVRCLNSIATVGAGGKVFYDFATLRATDPRFASAEDNSNYCEDVDGAPRFTGPVREVRITDNVAFVASPTEKLNVSAANATIYGVVLGGHINAPQGARFYSFSAMREGLPGLGNSATLKERSIDANMAVDGVSVALKNFPLIRSSKDGVN